MNRGKIYLQRSKAKWRMADEDESPTGEEFEAFWRELDSFVSGYFHAHRREEEPAYARGDFFGERTEAIYFRDRSRLSVDFVRAIQKWLSSPRRSNWRILIPGEKLEENYITIYDDVVALAPGIASLADAISEREKSA